MLTVRFSLEFDHVFVLHLLYFAILAEAFEVELLVVAVDEYHQGATFDVLLVELYQFVVAHAADLVGHLGARIGGEMFYLDPVAHLRRQAAEVDIVRVAYREEVVALQFELVVAFGES